MKVSKEQKNDSKHPKYETENKIQKQITLNSIGCKKAKLRMKKNTKRNIKTK